jgi:hypothetical protein
MTTMTNDQFHVVDPISPEDADAPEELLKRDRFGDELAHAMASITCEQHGVEAKTWHVGVEMRHPIEVRDRFFVTLDADEKRIRDIGPMSADIANHLLMFIESGIEAQLPGTDAGTISREIMDLSHCTS